MKLTFPPHKASMTITHNDHKNHYQSAEDWVLYNERDPKTQYAHWISDEERSKAIAEDSIWTLQWYPETPVGFFCVAASSFEALMEFLDGRATHQGISDDPS